jgi:membrane protease YdiL (CAAX protease family)
MHAIGLSSAVYLFYLLVLIPYAAIRSARRFNAAASPDGAPPWRPLPSRLRMFTSTSIILVVLFALAWFTARSFGYHVFAVPRFGAREALSGVAALAVCVATIFVGRAIRTPEEIAKLPVNRLMPHGARETAAYSMMSIAAGISEEAAYRGVLTQVLWYSLGNPWIAVFIAAAAFAVAHALQGWKSTLIIFVIACVMHALVWFTGTLVIAMVVHATYDLAVPTIRRRISRGRPTDPERSAG